MPAFAEQRRVEEQEILSFRPSEGDPHQQIPGVLLSDEIIFYAENHHLIRPFNRANLKPAGYELTIGNEYFLSGTLLELDSEDDDKNTVTIAPFEVAVLKTAEILCLPRYMIARWNQHSTTCNNSVCSQSPS